MKGYVFDPGRLARPAKQLERDGYVLAARLLRDYLGGDPLAEARRRARRDPVLRALFVVAADELAEAVRAVDAEVRRREATPEGEVTP